MDIVWVRDLVIVVYGLVGALFFIFMAILAYLFYRRTVPILDSVKVTAETIERMSCAIEEEVVKPIVQASAFVKGVRRWIELITKLFK